MFWRKRFPICYQRDAMDCGLACLDMVARYHGRAYPRHFINEVCPHDRQGSALASIARGAERLGFRTLSVKISFDDLKQKAPLPCIVFWPYGHYVVVYRIRGDRVYIADPAAGLTVYSREEFEDCWLMADNGRRDWGVVLLLETDNRHPVSAPEVPPAATVDWWRPLRRDLKRHLLPVGIGILISLSVQLILPFISAAVIDIGVADRNFGIVLIFIIAQLALLFSRLSVKLFQEWMLAYIGIRIDMRLVAQFLTKLTRLPMSFFDGKLIGDLIQRINDHKSLQQFLTQSLWQVLLAMLSLMVFGTVLAIFKPILFGQFAAGTALYIGYTALFMKNQRLLNYKAFHLSAQRHGLIVEFLAGMQEIKLNNAEQQRRWQWEAAQHAIGKVKIKTQLLNYLQASGCQAISEINNLILTMLVVREVINGQISLGTMVAVQYVIGQLSWPLNQISILLSQSHDAALSYARAREVHQIQDEERPAAQLSPDECADIEFRNVSFSYGAGSAGDSRDLLFRDLNLTIPRGKTTAIVGRSGSGKTTLLKLLLKFYEVGGGEVTLGGVNINRLSHYRWRELCGIVMQDGYIFSDTILSNIAVADEHPSLERVAEVTRAAQIASFIESLPLGYETRIGRDGVGISRGQAQRILIARALYKDPKYIFFDEATSALDAETESVIVDRLREIMRGKTAVVIAHRMSTVKHADQIILLDHGEIVEVGTHEELVACRGSYFNLIRNQLELGE
jgi:ATP-binding cassette, subfamily B, bacterial